MAPAAAWGARSGFEIVIINTDTLILLGGATVGNVTIGDIWTSKPLAVAVEANDASNVSLFAVSSAYLSTACDTTIGQGGYGDLNRSFISHASTSNTVEVKVGCNVEAQLVKTFVGFQSFHPNWGERGGGHSGAKVIKFEIKYKI